MIKSFCDICGRQFTDWDDVEHYKVKAIYKLGWSRLDVHNRCWKKMCEFIKNGFDSAIELASEPIEKTLDGVKKSQI